MLSPERIYIYIYILPGYLRIPANSDDLLIEVAFTILDVALLEFKITIFVIFLSLCQRKIIPLNQS